VLNGSGVDTSHFAATPLQSSRPAFLLIARLLGDKGIREYVEAARIVKARHSETRFRLVGDLDTNPDSVSSDELYEWQAGGAVEYLGKLNDVRSAIADCSVYVLPSYYREGTPRTVLEAMSMGRAIITTDSPGCRETVVEGKNGFLVATRSVDELVAAMEKLIERPDLIERMGVESRRIAEEKYDVHKVNSVIMREMGLVPAESAV